MHSKMASAAAAHHATQVDCRSAHIHTTEPLRIQSDPLAPLSCRPPLTGWCTSRGSTPGSTAARAPAKRGRACH